MKNFIMENYNKMGKLTLYLILLLIFTSIDYLLNVRWINSMKNYTYGGFEKKSKHRGSENSIYYFELN